MTENQPVSLNSENALPVSSPSAEVLAPNAGSDVTDVRHVRSLPNVAPTSRAERRAAARRSGTTSYSKKLGARLNYQQVVNVNQKRNRAWDDCAQMRNAVNVILNACTAVLPYMRSMEIREYIVDQAYLSRVALAMVEEVRGLYVRATKNSERHASLSGGASTMDETFTAYEIYNEYLMILECYDSGAGRLYEMVAEQLQLAVAEYSKGVGEETAKPVVDALTRTVHNMFVHRKNVDETVEAASVEQQVEEQTV